MPEMAHVKSSFFVSHATPLNWTTLLFIYLNILENIALCLFGRLAIVMGA